MIYGTAQLLDPRSVVTRCTGGTVSIIKGRLFLSRLLSFFLSLSRIAPLVFFPPFSLRSPVPLLLRYAASAVPRSPPLALSFVSHSEEDVNCLALGPNQYQWPPKRRQTPHTHRERKRDARGGQYRLRRRQRAERARGRDASSYGTDDNDDGGVGGVGRRRIEWEVAHRCET